MREIDKALAHSFKEGIEKQVPGVAPINEATQNQMGVNTLIEDALARRGGMGGHIASGVAGTVGASAVPPLLAGQPLAAAGALGTSALVLSRVSPRRTHKVESPPQRGHTRRTKGSTRRP